MAPSQGLRGQWPNVLALSVLWGCAFLFFRILAASLPPFTIVLGRVGIAALALGLVMAARGERPPADRKLWLQFAILGLLNNLIPFSLAAAAIRSVPTGLAAILNISAPIFALVGAHFTTRDEKLTPPMVLGVAIAAVGVVILVGPSVLGQASEASALGELMFLGVGASLGAGALYGRRFRDLPPLTVATGQLTASTLLVLPLSLAFDHPWTLPPPSLETWGALLGIALLSSSLGYLLFFRILAAAGAGASQLVTFIMPAVAVLAGRLVLHERLPLRAYAGMAVIAAALAVIGRTARRPSRT